MSCKHGTISARCLKLINSSIAKTQPCKHVRILQSGTEATEKFSRFTIASSLHRDEGTNSPGPHMTVGGGGGGVTKGEKIYMHVKYALKIKVSSIIFLQISVFLLTEC